MHMNVVLIGNASVSLVPRGHDLGCCAPVADDVEEERQIREGQPRQKARNPVPPPHHLLHLHL